MEWAKWCKDHAGAEDVYICIDGSNDDCTAKGVEFAEKGEAKSKKNRNIVSFTYAVTENGLPITYQIYRGGLIDAKALNKVINFLENLDLKVKGVILDRGYCSESVFTRLKQLKIKYVVMVKGRPEGFTVMYEDLGKHLKFNGDTFLLGTRLFALQRKVKIFKKSEDTNYLTIFFSHENASGEISTLMDKLNKEAVRVGKLLEKGRNPVINQEVDKILFVEEVAGKDGITRKKVSINPIEFNVAIDEKGLYSILTSEEMSPTEVDRLYNCRDASEKTYSIIKTRVYL